MRGNLPRPEFVLHASMKALEDLELASLNRAANLGKAIRAEVETLAEQAATAMLARWMIENRETLLQAGISLKQAEPMKAFELFPNEKAG